MPSKSNPGYQKDKGKDSYTLIETLVSRVATLSDQVTQLLEENKEQAIQNRQLIETIKELKDVIVAKDACITELEEKNNKDSLNSSKPSSSDFFNKPANVNDFFRSWVMTT
ncbi:MAG: hypothetical protein EOM45_10265 [Clostridia bacterium]|nr:hypothetical protein [Clostridia bacterium]